MNKALEWIKGHKPHTVALVAVLVVVIGLAVAAGCGVLSTQSPQQEQKTAELTLDITANAGWDENSTPAIAHIESKDNDVDFYHAIYPDASGNKGVSSVTLAEGNYTVSFISPINSDGSVYDICNMGYSADVTVKADTETAPSVDCSMMQIPADQVTDEMLQGIINQTKDAIENGDETLKGNAGKDVLSKLEGNIANNPNASDGTKQEAADAEQEVDVNGAPVATTPNKNATDNSSSAGLATTSSSNTASGFDSSSSSGAGNNASSGASSSSSSNQSSQPAHQHVWKNHTATKQVWVSNWVDVPDYETKRVPVANKFIFAYDGYTTTNVDEAKAHAKQLIKAGLPDNYRTEAVYETQKVQVGSHKEDHGHYETQTYTDYQYCDCGATR